MTLLARLRSRFSLSRWIIRRWRNRFGAWR